MKCAWIHDFRTDCLLFQAGGGGDCTPLAVPATLRRAQRLGLEELCLIDVGAERLYVYGIILLTDVAVEGAEAGLPGLLELLNAGLPGIFG